MVSDARMRQLGGGLLFLLLVSLCRQTGGQPCQLCDPKGGAGSCVPMTPPKGVTIDSALCSTIENKHKDYHDTLCKKYPPPNGYMYECTNPGTSNTFSCRSSCGPPLEAVGKGLSLNLLQGGGMFANFNSRPQNRGTGLFNFNTFAADKGRGDTNFGRFGTLASLNSNNNNNNNNNNNKFNLFRNNRNPSFSLLNPRAGNFRNNLLPQTRPLPVSGGITPSRSGPRLQNPQPRGSTLPNLSPSNSVPSRNQLFLNTPSLPDHRPSSSTVNDQPPPVGTLVSDSDGYNPPFPGHSAQGQDGPLSPDDQGKEGDKKVNKEANSLLSGPRTDSNTDETQDDINSPITSIPPKEGGDVQPDPQINPDPQTAQLDDREIPTSQGISDGQDSSSGSSPNEANVQYQNLLAKQDPEKDSQGNPPETLTGEASSSDTLDRFDQQNPVQENEEKEKTSTGNAFQGESPAEPPYGLRATGGTYPVDLGSDEAYPGSPPPQDPEETAGSHPDLPPPPPPPPPPQTYLQDQSPGADSSLGSPEHSKSVRDGAKELYPKARSPDQASVLNSADQAAPGVSHEQPPPSATAGDAVPSDPNSYSNNPEHPGYSNSQPPESYPDLDLESPQGTGQEPDRYTDPPLSPPADLKDKSTTENLIESSPQDTASLPASASVDSPGGDDYPEKAAPISGNSLSQEVEEYGEGKKKEEQEPVEGDYGEYPVNDEGQDITSRKDYNPANPKTSPTSYPTTSQSDGSENPDVYNSNNKDNNGNYSNSNGGSTRYNNIPSESSSEKNDEYSYERNNNDIDKKNNEGSANINNHNNLPPEAFQNPFKNPSSPHPKRADHFESNPAFVGTSLFSEGFLDAPGESFHPGTVASRPREPDAVDIEGYQIFPGFQEFEKTGDTEVLGMRNNRQPSNNQQNNIFSLFLQPTVNQPATRGIPSSPQAFGYRTLNPTGNPGQNLDASGFQTFPRPSGRNGQNSPGAVFGGGVYQGGRTGGYRDGDGAFNPASASGTYHPASRTNPSLSSPRLPPPSLPHPNAGPPTPTRTPYPRYPSQSHTGGGSFGGTNGGDAARLSGGSGFNSRQGSFNLGSGDVGSKTSSTSSPSSGDQGGPAGSFTRAGVRGGFVGFRSSDAKDEFGFPGTFGRFNDEGFDGKTSFDNTQLSDDMFNNVSSQSDTSEQPLSSSSSSSPDGPQT